MQTGNTIEYRGNPPKKQYSIGELLYCCAGAGLFCGVLVYGLAQILFG